MFCNRHDFGRVDKPFTFVIPRGLQCVRENRVVPKGLMYFPHLTQRSASRRAIMTPRLRRLFFELFAPLPKGKLSSHADTSGREGICCSDFPQPVRQIYARSIGGKKRSLKKVPTIAYRIADWQNLD